MGGQGELTTYIYYCIINTTSESKTEVTGRYATLAVAMKDLENKQDWYRPKGTGKIYRVGLNFNEDMSITRLLTLVYVKE